jgi:hypothetical protein
VPFLAPAVPVLAGAGAAGGTAATGGAILGGLTASQLLIAGAVVVGGVIVSAVANDYLDRPVTVSETDAIIAQAGAKSKADRATVTDCKNCVWCQINIQAQGTYLPLAKRSDPQGIGPYLVIGRTVFAREGVIIAELTHVFAKTLATRSNFRKIEDWNLLGRTIEWILQRPPGGIPNGEYRVSSPSSQNSLARYDINVLGTINAFML